jgi:hypothetical protein
LNKFTVLGAVAALVFVTPAMADDAGLRTKWSNEVGAIIKPVAVVADKPSGLGYRFVTITYEALKPCRSMTVMGHAYTKDDIQLPGFIVGQKMNVAQEQKFRDQFMMTYESGGYVVLDQASCH